MPPFLLAGWDAHCSGIGNENRSHILCGMARNEIRPVIKLRSTAGTGFTYVTRKNRRNDPDRLVLRKYDPVAGRHVDFREER
ncbi:large subunit ribosomal protein L33 [Streptomyces sp. PanSC19]|nr:large subunit ribosomal protein L33 [Streptomyces sp. PanSC19]